MRALLLIGAFLVLVPINAFTARLVATVPQGVSEVELLSGGTLAVLDHLKDKLSSELKAVSDLCQLGRLEAELKASAQKIEQSDKAYNEKVESIKKHYIGKVPVTIHSAKAQITSESALGEINFIYTARNNSDKIISDITYRPLIDKVPLPITTMLVLEFINSKSLISGLAPGEELTNQGHEPEHLSFFLSELKAPDIARIKKANPSEFTIEVTDIHFISQKGYKGQTKAMDVKEAFAGVLSQYQGASQQAREDNKARAQALADAKALYETRTKGSINDFRTRSKELQKASVRYQGSVDPKKNRATIESIKPGKYYIYAVSTQGKAIFREITIEEGKNKIKLETPVKDPFEP